MCGVATTKMIATMVRTSSAVRMPCRRVRMDSSCARPTVAASLEFCAAQARMSARMVLMRKAAILHTPTSAPSATKKSCAPTKRNASILTSSATPDMIVRTSLMSSVSKEFFFLVLALDQVVSPKLPNITH